MSELTDETVNQIDEYIEKCRAMHRSHFGHVPRFAHAISALADERSALLDRVASLEAAIWNACDAFRSMGCSADADELEEAMDTSKERAQSARELRYQDRPTAADSAVGTTVTADEVPGASEPLEVVPASEYDALAARLAEALFLLNRWHEAYHADGGMEMLDDDTTTCLAGITVSADVLRTPDDPLSPHYDPTHTATVSADSAPAVTCDHFPGQAVCEWCKGTGAIDAPTSADDPSCPDCDGEGHV